MEEPISAANANRNFSQILRSVREGSTYVVMSHGKPVAKIVPIGKADKVAAGEREALLERLESEPVTLAGRWTRDELYEDA